MHYKNTKVHIHQINSTKQKYSKKTVVNGELEKTGNIANITDRRFSTCYLEYGIPCK